MHLTLKKKKIKTKNYWPSAENPETQRPPNSTEHPEGPLMWTPFSTKPNQGYLGFQVWSRKCVG